MTSARPTKAEGDVHEVPVRLSHLLQHCSVGAVVRDGDKLMVVPDISRWDKPGDPGDSRQLRYVDQVRHALGIGEMLRTPPIAKEVDGRWTGWIPADRFPLWTRCVDCGLLHRAPWRRHPKEVHCSKPGCSGILEQVPWVLVHEYGYLADVPWHAVAHEGSRSPRQRDCEWSDEEAYLRIEQKESRRVVCERCNAANELPRRFPYGPTTWQQPWFHEPPPSPLDDAGWLLEINNVRVHSTDAPSALVIPPESRIRRGSVVDRLYGNTERRRSISAARNGLQRRSELKKAATEYGCTVACVEQALEEIEGGYPLFGQALDQQELTIGEYQALCNEIPELRDDEDFVTAHHTSAWHQLLKKLDSATLEQGIGATVCRLVSVRKLKEIMVLKGFRRVGSADGPPTPPDITGSSNWLPAIELYGEGVFFTLNEGPLQRWEQEAVVRERAAEFEQRYRRHRDLSRPALEVTPRFLLCHTLAHLMIRRLEAEAGYPAASLKERIYSAPGMAGILIYVAVADEQGSLGGLMAQADPPKFLRLLVGACEAAQWCSLDPVCSQQAGHGPFQLNRAACHACALVPETSCAYGNVLLDRTFLCDDDTGFFTQPTGNEEAT